METQLCVYVCVYVMADNSHRAKNVSMHNRSRLSLGDKAEPEFRLPGEQKEALRKGQKI